MSVTALFAVKIGVSPVIIDNTNTQAWEMLPYVEMVSYVICSIIYVVDATVCSHYTKA